MTSEKDSGTSRHHLIKSEIHRQDSIYTDKSRIARSNSVPLATGIRILIYFVSTLQTFFFKYYLMYLLDQ